MTASESPLVENSPDFFKEYGDYVPYNNSISMFLDKNDDFPIKKKLNLFKKEKNKIDDFIF